MRVERIGNCTLYLADCQEAWWNVEAAAVITDPPYGISAKLGMGGGSKGSGGMWAVKHLTK